MEIANGPQFLLQPAALDFFRIFLQRVRRGISGAERFVNGFGGEHPALDRRMNPLEPLRIQQARRIANDQPAIDVIARLRIPPAVGYGFRAVPYELAAFQNFLHEWMRLESLKRRVRIEERIAVFEPHYHAERHAIVAQAVNPSATVNLRAEGPAQRVGHVAGVDPSGLNVPQLLDADAVDLRIQSVELEMVYEFLGQRAARSFGQHGDF